MIKYSIFIEYYNRKYDLIFTLDNCDLKKSSRKKIQTKQIKIFLSSKRQDKRKYINVEDIFERISYYFKKYEKVAQKIFNLDYLATFLGIYFVHFDTTSCPETGQLDPITQFLDIYAEKGFNHNILNYHYHHLKTVTMPQSIIFDN